MVWFVFFNKTRSKQGEKQKEKARKFFEISIYSVFQVQLQWKMKYQSVFNFNGRYLLKSSLNDILIIVLLRKLTMHLLIPQSNFKQLSTTCTSSVCPVVDNFCAILQARLRWTFYHAINAYIKTLFVLPFVLVGQWDFAVMLSSHVKSTSMFHWL